MKVSFQTINTEIKVGSKLSTRWGNDNVTLLITWIDRNTPASGRRTVVVQAEVWEVEMGYYDEV